MPQYLKNAPDDQDVFNLVAAIGEDYGALVEITVVYKADYIESVARSYSVGGVVDKVVVYQAYHRRKYRPALAQTQVNFTLGYDILMQYSNGGATAARRGPTHRYDGRVEIPRRRNAQ
jgi:hypothetical protein